LSKFRIPYDIPIQDFHEALFGELQVHRIISVNICDNEAIVEIDDSDKRSAVLYTSKVAGIKLDIVKHHSALLPVWLSLKPSDKPFTIVHIDTHNDLGMPNLLRCEDKLIDRWTGNIVSPCIRSTVVQAIDSAAIEIGSYLTVALYWLPVTNLIWLCPEESTGVVRGMVNPRGLRLEWLYLDSLDSRVERLTTIPVSSDSYKTKIHVVKTTDEIREILLKHPSNNILLDIDLDYFDNSAENSDHDRDQPDVLPLSGGWMATQKARIYNILDALPLEGVVSVGIACSPGFCPAKKATLLGRMVINSFLERVQKDRFLCGRSL